MNGSDRGWPVGRSTAMIRPDCGLLANLARLNSDVVPLAMQIMDDSATREE